MNLNTKQIIIIAIGILVLISASAPGLESAVGDGDDSVGDSVTGFWDEFLKPIIFGNPLIFLVATVFIILGFTVFKK